MKKTILVVYSKLPLDKITYEKRYAFNTKSELKEGDLIKSFTYDSPMRVVKVLDESYVYFNKITGDFSNTLTNSNLFEIRDLVIVNSNQDAITATLIQE